MPVARKLPTAIVAGLVAALLITGTSWARTAAFLLDLAGVEDGVRRWIPIPPAPVTWTDVQVPTRHGPIAVRIYEPAAVFRALVVVFPGVHGGGVDAPRLTRLCERLAASGFVVACAPLPDLRVYRITSRSTDMMEDATAWLADSRWARRRRAALVGVSFAGGLALVAAGRETLRARVRAVVSIGGHGDLERTVDFLTSGALPDGTSRTPHDYPLAVIALTLADRLVPPDQEDGFRDIVRLFLDASLDGRAGTPEGQALLAIAADRLAQLPEPAHGLAAAVLARDVRTVGTALRPHVKEFARDPALSPALAPRPLMPVFLLHGTDDNVIPSTETPLTARDLETAGNRRVRWLTTPLLTHAHLMADAEPDAVRQLLHFWHDVQATVQ